MDTNQITKNRAKTRYQEQGQSTADMSALEVAAMGKLLQQQAAGDNEAAMLEMNSKDKDWAQLIQEAKSARGMKGWFAKNVNFTVNDIPFVGKVGFPVQAGVVPLFDGAAIDLRYAMLMAENPQKTQETDELQGAAATHKNWITGSGGMLVLAPVGMDNVVPFAMDQLTVTEQGITGRVKKNMEFHNRQKHLSIEASGLVLNKNMVELSDAKEVTTGETTERKAAKVMVWDGGVKVETEKAPAPKTLQEAASVTMKSEEIQTDAAQEAVERNDPQNLKADPTALQKLENKVAEEFEKVLTEDFAIGDAGDQEDQEDGEDKPTFGEVLKDAGAEYGKQTGKKLLNKILNRTEEEEDENAEGDRETTVGVTGNLEEGRLALKVENKAKESDDPTLIEQGKDKFIDELSTVTSNAAYAGITQKDLRAAGKVLTDEVENLSEGAQNMTDAMQDYIQNADPEVVQNFKKGELSEAEVKSELFKFLGLEESEGDQSANGGEGDVSGPIPLAVIPIVPFVTFEVTLTPDFKYGLFANISGDNLKTLIPNAQKLLGSDTDSKPAKLEFSAGLKASLGLEARAGFEEGIPFLITGFQGVFAKAEANGALKDDGTALSADVTLEINKKDNKKFELAKDVHASIKGGVDLTGSVGAVADVESKLFVWKKTLAEVTFKKWHLARIGMNFGMTKDKNAKGITGGWSLDEATVSLALPPAPGLGKAFTDANSEKDKYGLTTPDVSESPECQSVQEKFKRALDMLQYFAENKGSTSVLLPNQPSDNGVVDTIVNMQTVMDEFTAVWGNAQNALQIEDDILRAYLGSSGYKNKKEAFKSRIELHSQRVSGLQGWKANKTQHNKKQVGLEEHYASLKGNPGTGFNRALKEKVKDRALTFESISDYEKRRYLELTGSSTDRIEYLKKMIQEQGQKGAKEVTNDAIIAGYRERGGTKAFKHKARFVGSAEDIIKYERDQKNAKSADEIAHQAQTDRILTSDPVTTAKDAAREEVRKKAKKEGREATIKELETAANAARDRVFFQEYAKTLDTLSALKYGSINGLLAYEANKITSLHKGGSDNNYAAYLRASEGTAYEAGLSDWALKWYKKKVKGEMYRTASLQDLIEFERKQNGEKASEIIRAYLESKPGEKNNQDPEVLKTVLANKDIREKAMEAFSKKLDNREAEENIRFITIDMLQEYMRRKKEQTKKKSNLDLINNAISFLNRSKIILNATRQEEREEEEINQVRQFFNAFRDISAVYQEELNSGDVVNLSLMQEVIKEEESEHYKLLQDMAENESDLPAPFVVKRYLGLCTKKDERNQKIKDLNAFLTERQGDKEFDAGQIQRYHASLLSEETRDGTVGKHFARYTRLKNMDENGSTYSEMIKVYKEEFDGSGGYADEIKKMIAEGRINDGKSVRKLTVEDVLQHEKDRVDEAGAGNQKLIDYINANKDKMSYADLLENYEDMSKEQTFGAVKKLINRRFSLDSDYEKSKSGATFTPEQLLQYEEVEKERIGRTHADRLKKLFNVAELPDDLSTLVPPDSAEVKESRVKEYRGVAKRVENDTLVKLREEMEWNRIHLNEDVLYDEMYAYETGRKEHYEKEFNDIVDIEKQIRDRKDKLMREISMCHDVVFNMDEIKNNPTKIFERINEFKEAVDVYDNRKKEETGVEEEQQRLVTEAEKRRKVVEDEDFSDGEGGQQA